MKTQIKKLWRASVPRAVLIISALLSAAPAARAQLAIATGTNAYTATNATLSAVITNCLGAATSTCYYGRSDGTTNAGNWDSSITITAAADGVISAFVSPLQPATYYYYCWYAIETNDAWASASSNFITSSRPPTNWPTPGTGVTVIASSETGKLLSPTNFWDGNVEDIAGSTNAADIMVAFTPAGYSPATPDVEAHLVGIDNVLTNRFAIHGSTNITISVVGTNIYIISDHAHYFAPDARGIYSNDTIRFQYYTNSAWYNALEITR